MTVIETLLVFVGIPLLVVLLLVSAIWGKSLAQAPNRYRPGKAWTYAPRWFTAHPDALLHTATIGSTTAVGGASGEW
ncbi:MAG TPA: hypothetical protein VGL26_04560 [Jatrophihabitans sp.]|jgi:hypothetical protein